MFARVIATIVANALAIWAANAFVAGFIFQGDVLDALKAALIIGAVNFVLKPILKLASGFFILITFGLFNIAINMFLLWLVDYYVAELVISGIVPLFWSTLIFSAFNLLVYSFVKKK